MPEGYFRLKGAPDGLVITFIADDKAIPLGGFGIHLIQHWEICFRACAYSHTLFRRQAHVIACLLLHTRQHLFFGGRHVEQHRVTELDLLCGESPASGQEIRADGLAAWFRYFIFPAGDAAPQGYVRVEFQEDGSLPTGKSLQIVEHPLAERDIVPVQ